MADKKGFILYNDYKYEFEALSDSQCKALLLALFEFHENGNEPEFTDGMLKIAFMHMSRQLKRDMEKYEERCRKNREIALERERKKRESTNVHDQHR